MSVVKWHVVKRNDFGRVVDVSDPMAERDARLHAEISNAQHPDPTIVLMNRYSRTVVRMPRFQVTWFIPQRSKIRRARRDGGKA